ncbi:uncharacterized protein MYCGRDRAFT_96951 [Zymoseptoria tritici IPO323]|uniref:Uncharacterized protein n=1 Tax=Zymoseptoria tritici (strain CBS 115943 / IPO323) TaxID=336722 RepID=F9XNF0_ZYMTI|nr:uncharacterized protein MYCGRDRAFT_96951 [Zymoseptoria tritici IPO323]EGP82859.1 hypothetical protein MYCGRDRAFT_96951 [Zymoseptoria tritici IPO323]
MNMQLFNIVAVAVIGFLTPTVMANCNYKTICTQEYCDKKFGPGYAPYCTMCAEMDSAGARRDGAWWIGQIDVAFDQESVAMDVFVSTRYNAFNPERFLDSTHQAQCPGRRKTAYLHMSANMTVHALRPTCTKHRFACGSASFNPGSCLPSKSSSPRFSDRLPSLIIGSLPAQSFHRGTVKGSSNGHGSPWRVGVLRSRSVGKLLFLVAATRTAASHTVRAGVCTAGPE